MAALPAVPRVVRIDHHMTLAADANAMVRSFFRYTGACSTADATTWLAAAVTAFNTFVNSTLSNEVTTFLHELTDLSSATAAQVQSSTGASGASATKPVAAGVAMVLKYHIGRRYRGGHPRVYIPGLLNTMLSTASLWDPTVLGNVVTAWKTYMAACVAGTLPVALGPVDHVNVSFFQGYTNHTFPSGRVKPIPTPRATPLIDTITDITGNAKPGSQRRRNLQG